MARVGHENVLRISPGFARTSRMLIVLVAVSSGRKSTGAPVSSQSASSSKFVCSDAERYRYAQENLRVGSYIRDCLGTCECEFIDKYSAAIDKEMKND